jgi:hypothetical protein
MADHRREVTAAVRCTQTIGLLSGPVIPLRKELRDRLVFGINAHERVRRRTEREPSDAGIPGQRGADSS